MDTERGRLEYKVFESALFQELVLVLVSHICVRREIVRDVFGFIVG